MTTLEIVGERWARAGARGDKARLRLPGVRVGATLHFGPFAGWGAAGVVRADSWWRPLGYVVRDEDIVRAAGDIAWSREGIVEGQAFIIRVPPPTRPRRRTATALVVAAPVAAP